MNFFPQRLKKVMGLGQRARPNTRKTQQVTCSLCQMATPLLWSTFVSALGTVYCPSCRAIFLEASRPLRQR